ncbi:CBF-domain-containing protein [Paxillus ammoniavirescens]|nr:CBF-domain-containing protein [Paxillus ammoniavirescens]
MARLRKEKGIKNPTSGEKSAKKTHKKSTGSASQLKAEIAKLGGDDADFELVKDASDNNFTETQAEDPQLSKDVAKFFEVIKTDNQKDVQLEASPLWYQTVPPLPPSKSSPSVPPANLDTLLHRASTLHTSAVLAFQSKSTSTATSTNSEFAFLQKILHSGTLSDRLSALTLLVQSSPLHNTKALETLKNMAERGKGKGGREESLKALRCIIDWWVGGGAPNCKLKYFRDQPLTHPKLDDQHLLVWYFEDWLKKYFFSVLQILETLSTDPLPYVRTQALSLIFTLLREKPEQEHNLLRLLVNKLGDGEKSICSRASYHVLQLLQVHPSMKMVITREMTSLILRPSTSTPAVAAMPTVNTRIKFTEDGADPKLKSKGKTDHGSKKNVNDHARYYSTITFNQIVFGAGDRDVALQVVDVYFRMFEDLLGERKTADIGEVTADKDKPKDTTKTRRKGKEVVGDAGFAEVEDAHSKLISAILTGVNRALPFAKLGAADASLNKHIDTLFLITHTSTFNISLQALVLIQHISSSLASQPSTSSSASSLSKSISDRYYRTLYSSLHDGRLASSSKQTMYLNLLFKSLKADDSSERVKAFVRRFVQVLVSGGAGGTEFVVGGLYLLGEIFSTIPGLRSLLQSSSNTPEGEEYDPRKRDPQFAHASASPLYELLPLLHHYHPTISLHARQLLGSQPITSSPDLTLNTLSHFLDRFVYKNPKKAKPKGASVMQPAASANDGVSVKRLKGEISTGALPNEEKFWKRRVEDIPVDEVFFHKYFSRKNQRKPSKPGAADGGESDEAVGDNDESNDEETHSDIAESVPDSDDANSEQEGDEEDLSDIEEAAVWKAMQATIPREDGDDALLEEDSDEVPSDLDAASDEDDVGDGEDDGDESLEEADDSGDGISLAEGSDDDDLVAIDDVPGGLIEFDGSEAQDREDEEWGGLGGGDKRKRKDNSQGRRQKRRNLSTFASYEDYAKMIEDGPEDDI